MKFHVAANSQLFPPSTPTNSSARLRSKDLPPRPMQGCQMPIVKVAGGAFTLHQIKDLEEVLCPYAAL